MIDGVLLENGQSRAMRAILPATYEEFAQACAAGTQLLDIIFNAAGWQTQPTFLNKQNLLQDPTAAQYGLGPTATVDDAFSEIANRLALISGNMGAITATVQDTNGNPLQGVLVSGIFDDNGDTVQTNSSGVASGYIAEGQTTVSITGYADIQNFSTVLTVVKGSSYTETFTVTTQNFLKVLSTKFLKFSGNVSQADVTAVGGGGAGSSIRLTSANSNITTGSGGGGGYCTVQTNVPFQPNVSYLATVGAGGQSESSNGGASSFLGVTANGGSGGEPGNPSASQAASGGAGNPAGANGRIGKQYTAYAGLPGAAGSTQGYSSFTETVAYGGSGGGGALSNNEPGDYPNGGAAGGYGGKGGDADNSAYPANPNDGGNGQDGFGGGGGGGGACAIYPEEYSVYGTFGKGGSGCIAIRMHLKSAA